jgi:uncharacterized membrane protein
MNTLDERILIQAPTSIIWEHISDFTRNPSWQTDCVNISFLTTFHKGPGVRWRYSTKNRHDYVVQITAWYEGLGYEYTFIDGVAYRQNMGRIRLQDTPEGTVVQWTFSYELGGALSGLRDAIGHKRSVNAVMIDSLKKLWLYMKHKDRGNVVSEPKSLMRDAPDVEERAQYKPRHPSVLDQAPPPQPINIFAEPPASDEDTRPRPTARVEFASPVPSPDPEPTPEPDFLAKVATAEDVPPVVVETPKPIEEIEPDFLAAVRATQDMMPTVQKEEPPAAVESAAPPAPTAGDKPAVASDIDTSKLSVFELFGLPKPSETQEMRVVTSTSLLPVVDSPPIPPVAVEQRRRGMRILLRYRTVKVRRP